MQPRILLNITTYGLLCTAGAVSFMLPDTLTIPPTSAYPTPDEIQLTGIVRDFLSTHVDFGVSAPAGGFGHAAASVEQWLPVNGVPQLVPGGFKVEDQWRDKDGNPIAPHLYQFQGVFRPPGEGFGYRVADKAEFKNASMLDAFDSNYGPYGLKGNYGGIAVLSTNSIGKDKIKVDKKAYVRSEAWVGVGGDPNVVIKNEGYISQIRGPQTKAYRIPELFMPDLDVSLDGDVTIDSSTTLGAFETQTYLWYNRFEVRDVDTVLTIDGDVLIRVEDDLKVHKAQIQLLPDATLTFYVGGKATFEDNAIVNAVPGDTSRVTVNVIGGGNVELKKKAHVYANVIAPDSELHVKEEAQHYGGFIGEKLKVEDDGSGLHADLGSVTPQIQNVGLVAGEEFEVKDNAQVDGFDSTLGFYGGTNVGYGLTSLNSIKDNKFKVSNHSIAKTHVLVGPRGERSKIVEIDNDATLDGTVANLYEPVPLPVITPPTMSWTADKLEVKNTTMLIDSDGFYKEMKIENAIVQISGDVVIRLDKKLQIKNGHIVLLPGASLLLSIREEFRVQGDSSVNAGGDPSRVVIQKTSADKKQIELEDKTVVSAYVQANLAELKLKDDSEFFGSFIGKKVKIEKKAKFHVDTANLHLPTECFSVNDLAGTAGIATNGGVTSNLSFSEWFQNVPAVNVAAAHTITMTKDGTGAWMYSDNAFFPVDDRLLGNEGADHNYNFTYVLEADFVYHACTDQFFEVDGGDGAWLFVNGYLGIDLGGVRSDYEQYIELDRLGLEDGKTYRVKLYLAQRQGTASTFMLRTNVDLSTDNVLPSITAAFD